MPLIHGLFKDIFEMLMTHKISQLINKLTTGQLSVLVFAAAVILQLPLIFNPGYFSHDELQWAVWSGVSDFSKLPWLSWVDYQAYQYRPITFNLWLVVSYFLFDLPYLFHTFLVFWGALNAFLLFHIARRLQLSSLMAFGAVMVFVMSPFAMYVHGWVGTMADMLVMSCILAMILITMCRPAFSLVLISVFLLTCVALLSKESAVAIPAIFSVIWWFSSYKKQWLVATLVAGVMTVIYLTLRLPVLMQQPEQTHYTLSYLSPPIRWLEYQLYWVMPNLGEPVALLDLGWKKIVLFAGIIGVFWFVLWQTHRKLALLFLLGSLATLSPVLPIASSSAQYGYLFAAWSVVVVALAWKYASVWRKRFFVLMTCLSVLHGLVIVLMMHHVGQIQAVFSPALAEVFVNHRSDEPVLLGFSPRARQWIFRRLTHNIKSYQGIEIGDRIKLVEGEVKPDFLIQADGDILPNNP